MKRIDEVSRVDSCLNRAGDDEPIFVLRANDPCAPGVVRKWASDYFLAKSLPESDGQLTIQQIAKIREAYQLAREMEAWQRSRGIVTWYLSSVVDQARGGGE